MARLHHVGKVSLTKKTMTSPGRANTADLFAAFEKAHRKGVPVPDGKKKTATKGKPDSDSFGQVVSFLDDGNPKID